MNYMSKFLEKLADISEPQCRDLGYVWGDRLVYGVISLSRVYLKAGHSNKSGEE